MDHDPTDSLPYQLFVNKNSLQEIPAVVIKDSFKRLCELNFAIEKTAFQSFRTIPETALGSRALWGTVGIQVGLRCHSSGDAVSLEGCDEGGAVSVDEIAESKDDVDASPAGIAVASGDVC